MILKTEADGRMFPVTDSSQTIIDCLIDEVNKNQAVVLDYTSGLLEEPQTAVKSMYKESKKKLDIGWRDF